MSLIKYATWILGTAILTGCAQKVSKADPVTEPKQGASAGLGNDEEQVDQPTNAADALCAGRYLVGGPPGMRIDGSKFTYYWGDITTLRENASAYVHRLAKVEKAAKNARTLNRPTVRMNENVGMLMFTYEEAVPPFDPQTTRVHGYSHRDGVTVEFKKATVNRLLDVAQLRTREILGALHPRPARPAALSQDSFCAGDGVITLAPRDGWYEETKINGTFSFGGHRYKFLFTVQPLNAPEEDSDFSGRRATVAEMTDAEPAADESAEEEDLSVGTAKRSRMRLLKAENSEGTEFVIYEWRGAPSPSPNNAMVPYLHIWSLDQKEGSPGDALLIKTARNSPTNRPLFVRFAPLSAAKGAAKLPAAVAEESRVPYSMRLTYSDPTSSAPNVAYKVFRNSKLVAEGLSDKDGYTTALNADYGETWEIQSALDN